MQKLSEPPEPTVIVVLTARKLERAVILYNEDDPEGLKVGADILARVATQLGILDAALRED